MPVLAESAIPLRFERKTRDTLRNVPLWGRQFPCSPVDGGVFLGQSIVVGNNLQQEVRQELAHGFVATVIGLREDSEDMIEVLPERGRPIPLWIGRENFLQRYSIPHIIGMPHREIFNTQEHRVETLCFPALRGREYDTHVVAARFQQNDQEQIVMVGQTVTIKDQGLKERYGGIVEKLEIDGTEAKIQVVRTDTGERAARIDLFNVWE